MKRKKNLLIHKSHEAILSIDRVRDRIFGSKTRQNTIKLINYFLSLMVQQRISFGVTLISRIEQKKMKKKKK